MEQGLAPQRKNQLTGEMESMELHHDPAQRDGGMYDFVEYWPDEHANNDKFRRLGG
jgi:filamentous hemagglutinin